MKHETSQFRGLRKAHGTGAEVEGHAKHKLLFRRNRFIYEVGGIALAMCGGARPGGDYGKRAVSELKLLE